MIAIQKLRQKISQGFHICVGLDTDLQKIPAHLKAYKNPGLIFNKEIIEATKDITAAYKINFAFYEKNGVEGLKTLENTLKEIPSDILTIADAKRGDIGNTSLMYASSVFDYYNFDSVTVNPYMGYDSIEPFIRFENKIIYILALTSNNGSADFQKLKLENGSYLFQNVISKIHTWNREGNCGIVFGATNSTELKENLSLIKNLPVLLPGIGAQGGDLKSIVELFSLTDMSDYMVNVSRSVLYKSSGMDFTVKAREELLSLNNLISESTKK